MSADRWRWITGTVYTPEVEAAIAKQARGEHLTDDERRELNEANAIIASETRRWERGEPIYPDDGTPTPSASAAATVEPSGTPTPGDPNFPMGPPPTGTPDLSAVPDLGPPAEAAAPEVYSPDDVLTVRDDRGNQMVMTRREYDAQDPSYQSLLTVVNAEGPGARSTVAPRPTPANDLDAPAFRPTQIIPNAPGTTSATPSAPAPAIPPPSPPTAARPVTVPPARTGPLNPSYPGEGPAGRPGAAVVVTKPPTAAAGAAPRAAAPPRVPNLAPPSPFEQDPTGASLPEGRLTRAIARAGGRPTERVATRVAGEIGEVFRLGDAGGYRGDTGGWRTLAHQAADAWEQQNRAAPETLRPSEREAYRRDPTSLYRTILQADSPFRDYRESWIGATRAGQAVPGSAEFTNELRPYGAAPGQGATDATDQGGIPRERTPVRSVTVGAEAPTDTTDRGGVPREYTPASATNAIAPTAQPPSPPPEADLTTAPEPQQVVPYADEPAPPDAHVVVIAAPPDLAPPDPAELMPEGDMVAQAYPEDSDDGGATDQGGDGGEYPEEYDQTVAEAYPQEEPTVAYDDQGGYDDGEYGDFEDVYA